MKKRKFNTQNKFCETISGKLNRKPPVTNWNKVISRRWLVSLTDHVLPDVSHGVKLLLTDLAGELLFRVAVHDLVVLV